MYHRTPLFRSLFGVVALLVAALACNLKIGGDASSVAPAIPTIERPVVEIITPAEGARFIRGQTVSVQARATSPSGVTLVELLVNGIRVASQPPAEAINPTTLDVVLDYQAEQPGTISLAVRAYSNSVVGQPAQRTITVLPELAPGNNGAGTPQTFFPPSATPYNPQCRARVNTGGLRFRAGPGIDYNIINNFNIGQEPTIQGYADMPDGRWWQVMWAGQIGWTSAAYTTQLGNCNAIRPAIIPPSPTPQPSATPEPTIPGATSTPTLPDLQLSLLTGPSEIRLDVNGVAQANFPVQVQNNGGQVSGPFRVAVLKPNGEEVYYDIPGLNLGQTYDIGGTGGLVITFNTPGVMRILVTVDNQNNVAESAEDNNQAYKDITVSPGPLPTETATNTSSDQSGGSTVNNIEPLSPISAANADHIAQLSSLQGHGGLVTRVTFNPSGDILASASRDGTIRLWSTPAGSALATLAGHTDRVLDVVFSPDGSRLASGSHDGTVRLWQTETGAELARIDHGAVVNHIAFSPDGSRLASGGANPEAAGGLDGLALIWNVSNSQQLNAIQTYGPISGIEFFNNTTLVVATQGKDCNLGGGAVELYDVNTGELMSTLVDSSDWIDRLAVNPFTSLIAGSGQVGLCTGEGLVWVWHANGSLQTILDLGNETSLTGLAFSPDGNLIASSSASSSVRLWDTNTGVPVAHWSGHAAHSLAFSPNGVLVAAGNTDSSVSLWGIQ